MNNPYEVLYEMLGIDEGASDLEIYEAVVQQVKQYCLDYKNNSDQAHLVDLFCKAGYFALNAKGTKESIDLEKISKGLNDAYTDSHHGGEEAESLKKKNAAKEKSNLSLLLKNFILSQRFQLKDNRQYDVGNDIDDMYIDCNDVFAVIGSDNSFMFVREDCVWKFILVTPTMWEVRLTNIFTDNIIAADDSDNVQDYSSPEVAKTKWRKGKIFKADGIPSFAIPASKLIPDYLVTNGEIETATLKNINMAVGNYLVENPSLTEEFFREKKKSSHKKKKSSHKKKKY